MILSKNNGSKSKVKPIFMHVFTIQMDKASIKPTVRRMVLNPSHHMKKSICKTIKEIPLALI